MKNTSTTRATETAIPASYYRGLRLGHSMHAHDLLDAEAFVNASNSFKVAVHFALKSRGLRINTLYTTTPGYYQIAQDR